jgi:hypothetical protein
MYRLGISYGALYLHSLRRTSFGYASPNKVGSYHDCIACYYECLLKRHPREIIFTGCPRGIYRAEWTGSFVRRFFHQFRADQFA